MIGNVVLRDVSNMVELLQSSVLKKAVEPAGSAMGIILG